MQDGWEETTWNMQNFQPEKHKITKCCIFFFTRRHNEGRQGPQMEVQWPRACSRPTELPWDSGLSGRTDGCSGWSTFSPVFEAAGQVGLLSSLKLVGISYLVVFRFQNDRKVFVGIYSVLCQFCVLLSESWLLPFSGWSLSSVSCPLLLFCRGLSTIWFIGRLGRSKM